MTQYNKVLQPKILHFTEAQKKVDLKLFFKMAMQFMWLNTGIGDKRDIGFKLQVSATKISSILTVQATVLKFTLELEFFSP